MSHAMERGGVYQIEVRGALDQALARALGGMRVVSRSGPPDRSLIILEGELRDQAAVLGVLQSLLQLDVSLVSVRLVERRT
jgi:hypothetical protein